MVDYERLKALTQGIADSEQYTFEKYCGENDLFKKGREFKAGGVWIACPFHGDLSPSLSFNEERGIWHCFGCGAGGKLVDFMYRHYTEVLGHELSKVNYLNNLLKEDESLQIQLGFSSVFQEDKVSIESLELLEKPKIAVRGMGITSYSELQEKFMKGKPSRAEVKLFIVMMQNGLSVQEMARELLGSDKGVEKKYDFTAMDCFE